MQSGGNGPVYNVIEFGRTASRSLANLPTALCILWLYFTQTDTSKYMASLQSMVATTMTTTSKAATIAITWKTMTTMAMKTPIVPTTMTTMMAPSTRMTTPMLAMNNYI